jgi:hypothetical protein
MGKYAVIVDGVVVNLIVADEDFVDQWDLETVLLDDESPTAIGWTYDGEIFLPAEPTISNNPNDPDVNG